MNSTVANLYKDVRNTIVVSTDIYRALFVELEDHLETKTDSSKGYICNKRSLFGMVIESSVWCKADCGYYFDKQGNIHSLTFDLERGTFNVASI